MSPRRTPCCPGSTPGWRWRAALPAPAAARSRIPRGWLRGPRAGGFSLLGLLVVGDRFVHGLAEQLGLFRLGRGFLLRFGGLGRLLLRGGRRQLGIGGGEGADQQPASEGQDNFSHDFSFI